MLLCQQQQKHGGCLTFTRLLFVRQREATITSRTLQVGHSFLPRTVHSNSNSETNEELLLLHQNLGPLEALMKCVQMNWMAILVSRNFECFFFECPNNVVCCLLSSSTCPVAEIKEAGVIHACTTLRYVIFLSAQLGPSCSGKTSLVQLLATFCGRALRVLPMNSAMDTTELLGGFEQVSHLDLFPRGSLRWTNVKLWCIGVRSLEVAVGYCTVVG